MIASLMATDLLDPRELAFLVAARYALLATVDSKGRPRAVPVCFVVEAHDGGGLELLIPLDDKPKSIDDKHGLARVRDIERHPEVGLLVDHWDEDWSKLGWLRLQGHATVLEPDEVSTAFPQAVEQLRGKYPQYVTHDLESSPMIFINIERAVSWGAMEKNGLAAPTPDFEGAGAGSPLLIAADGSIREGSDPTEDQIDLPIGGRAVSAVAVSRFVPFLRLHFWGREVSGSDFELQIDGQLRIVASGRDRTIDPESGPDPAYLLLVDKTVSSAVANADGSLDVEFTDGDRLLVAPGQYEPWQLNGDDGTLVVSVAGGGLSVWEADSA